LGNDYDALGLDQHKEKGGGGGGGWENEPSRNVLSVIRDSGENASRRRKGEGEGRTRIHVWHWREDRLAS